MGSGDLRRTSRRREDGLSPNKRVTIVSGAESNQAPPDPGPRSPTITPTFGKPTDLQRTGYWWAKERAGGRRGADERKLRDCKPPL